MNFNDRVEVIFEMLYEDESFRKYLDAVYDCDAVEGSLVMDDAMATLMIRDRAKGTGQGEVAKADLATILRALKVVLRRGGVSRSERREKVLHADFMVTPMGDVCGRNE